MNPAANPPPATVTPAHPSDTDYIRGLPGSPERPGWILGLAALLTLVAITAIVCLVFWPGHMDLDSIGEIEEAQTGRYMDWHTPLLSAMWGVVMPAGLRSPGWVLAGSVLTLLVGLYLILRSRLPRPWAALLAAVVLAFPPVLGFAVHVGRDTWFASFLVCGFGFAARAARTSGRSRTLSLALAVTCAFLAGAARQNSPPAVLGLLCAVAVLTLGPRWRGIWQPLGIAGAGMAVTLLVIGTVIGLQRVVLHAAVTHPEQGTYDYDLVALSTRTGTVLLPPDVYPRQDLEYLRQWSSILDPNPLLWGPQAAIPPNVEGKQLESLQRAWLTAIRQDPFAYLRMRARMALYQLAIDGDANFVYQVPPQPPGSGFSPGFPALHAAVMRYIAVGSTAQLNGNQGGPLQRIWVYALLLFLATAWYLASRRRVDTVLGLLGAGVLLYSAVALLLAPSVLYRYMYPAVVAGTILTVLLALDAVREGWRRRTLTRLAPRTGRL